MTSIIQDYKFGKFSPTRCAKCDSCLTTKEVDDMVFNNEAAKLTFTVKCIVCGELNHFAEAFVPSKD